MKITIIQGAFFPIPPLMGGGCEKIWYRMGQEFAREGHEVVHISRACPPELPAENVIEGVRHVRVQGYNKSGPGWKLKLQDLLYSRRACRVIPPDAGIIITNTFWSPILLKKKAAHKLYISVERIPKGQLRWYPNGRLRANSVAVAEAIKNELPSKEHYRVVMIPNALPFSVDEHVDIHAKKPVLLYSGRVHPEKGIHLMVQAMRLLENPWPLRIVGPWQAELNGGGDDYKKSLDEMAKGLPITFVGPVHDDNVLNAEYQSAAVFVYPSVAEKGETFGVANVEAMSWGCAPIVSSLDCFKDFIRQKENGLIFNHRGPDAAKNLADAIRTLTTDTTLRQNISQKALEVRQVYSPRAVARLFLADFASMVENQKNSKP
jgi:glycosyltransferase involved in cell wall biosynthesis